MNEADPTPDGVLAAGGAGSEIFDAPVLFFLTHEEHIRRWYALGDAVRQACRDYLLTFEPDLEALAAERGLVATAADTAGGYHHVLLSRPGTETATDGTPAAAFCFGWNSNRVRLSPHTYTPFFGIRTPVDEIGARARDALLSVDGAAVRTLRSKLALRGSGERQWPVWEPVQSPYGWWTDLDAHRRAVLARGEELLDAFGAYLGDASEL